MVLAAELSADLNLAPREDAQRLAALLQRLGLPVKPATTATPQQLLELIRLNKKNLSGRLRLILWRGLGNAVIVPNVPDAAILERLANP